MPKAYTLLAVDDETDALQLVKLMLSNTTFHIITAQTGNEALDIAQHTPIDVVLLDILLPEMSGVTVCGHLRAIPRLRDIPIVMLTALEDYETRRAATQAGATDLLTKPVTRDELLGKLNGVMAEYQAATQGAGQAR